MKFEVLRNNTTEVVFHTEYASCLPDNNTLKQIRSAGYRFRVNGRIADKEKILTTVAELRKEK